MKAKRYIPKHLFILIVNSVFLENKITDTDGIYKRAGNANEMYDSRLLTTAEFMIVDRVKSVDRCITLIPQMKTLNEFPTIQEQAFCIIDNALYGLGMIGSSAFEEYKANPLKAQDNPRGELIYAVMAYLDQQLMEWKAKRIKKAIEL